MATKQRTQSVQSRICQIQQALPHTVPRANPSALVFRNEEREVFENLDAEFASCLEESAHCHDKAASTYVSAQNVVCVVHLSENVALRKVAMRYYNKYVPQKFEACIVRQRWGASQATILLFRTGNAVCVGTKSVEESMLACHTLRLELYASKYKTFFGRFRPVNSVYSFKVPHYVDLARLHFENQNEAQWVPELFPGLELGLTQYKAVVRVFDTGNCVLMGVEDFKLRGEITREVKAFLKNYKDTHVPEEGRFQYRNAQIKSASHGIKAVERPSRVNKRGSAPLENPPAKRARVAAAT